MEITTYLVTTNRADIPADHQIIMVDGTVPEWQAKQGDLHYDHHRPGGSPIQIEEIQKIPLPLGNKVCFATTQVDADACAAAAWIQLLNMGLSDEHRETAYTMLAAIAYDCDHLGLPPGRQWNPLRQFAAKAVAALKESGNAIAESMNLPPNRRDWNETQRRDHASQCFKLGTEWLIEAALSKRLWPGELGEADPYFAQLEKMREPVYRNCRIYRGCAVLDQRTLEGYIDPRLLVDWARLHQCPSPVTLTIRNGDKLPNAATLEYPGELYSYTLGSVPLHPQGSPNYSDRKIWEALAALEAETRARHGLQPPTTTWGGRNEVGGSGWRDPSITPPEQVLDAVLR